MTSKVLSGCLPALLLFSIFLVNANAASSCVISNVQYNLQSPSGIQSGWIAEAFFSTSGSCPANMTETWKAYNVYNFCPEAGNYLIRTRVFEQSQSGGGSGWTNSGWVNAYTVNYCTSQAWCECSGSTWTPTGGGMCSHPECNQPPIPSFEVNPKNGLAPLTINITNTTTDPEGQLMTYEWVFDPVNGVESTAKNPVYIYTTGGAKTITLTATDVLGASASTSRTINVKQMASITLFNTNHPVKPADPAFVSFSCNKSTNIKLSFFDNEDNTVLPDEASNCTESPLVIQKTFPESGIYKIVARITIGLNGPYDTTCDNCPKTVYSVVGMEVKDMETPETTLILVAGIAFAVIAIIGRKH